jgi:UDP-2,3-diacylglucosamine hydrolase
MATLLLSDLHLPVARLPLHDTFIDFLAGPARKADAVYILGDLFDYWIGDDVGVTEHAAEVAALRALTANGVPVYFQGGNRDFMVGAKFFEATGVRPLPDPHVVELGGVRTLLSHGDQYCSDDESYQRWRRFSRRPLAQWGYSSLPASLRLRIAGGLRKGSNQKMQSIMDVTDAAIERAFATSDAPRMIHGHTHRPAIHRLTVAGKPRERIVLADWRPGHAEYLECDGANLKRQTLS